MKTFSRFMAALACWATLVHSAFAAGRDVTVQLPGVVSRSSGAVRVQVRVPRDADNRVLRVTLDSDGFYRSSDVPLDGEQAPQNHTVIWRALPVGAYEVRVELVGTARVKQVVRRQLHVVGLE